MIDLTKPTPTSKLWWSLQPGERIQIGGMLIEEHGFVDSAERMQPTALMKAYNYAHTLSVEHLQLYIAFVRLDELVVGA